MEWVGIGRGLDLIFGTWVVFSLLVFFEPASQAQVTNATRTKRTRAIALAEVSHDSDPRKSDERSKLISRRQLICRRELADLIQHILAISGWLMMRGFPLLPIKICSDHGAAQTKLLAVGPSRSVRNGPEPLIQERQELRHFRSGNRLSNAALMNLR